MTTSKRATVPPPPRSRSRGAVLLIVMMVMLGLLGLGITALWLTSGNVQISANVNQRTMALYVAEAGIERARVILNALPPPPLGGTGSLLAGTVNVNTYPPPNGLDAAGQPNRIGVYLVDPNVAGIPALVDVQFPPNSFGRAEGTVDDPRPALMGQYTVWVRNDTAELRLAAANVAPTDPKCGVGGTNNYWTCDVNGAVVVRSRGVAVDGRTQVVLEVAMGSTPGGAGEPDVPGGPPPVLCNAGKNSCDDNNSVISGIVAN